MTDEETREPSRAAGAAAARAGCSHRQRGGHLEAGPGGDPDAEAWSAAQTGKILES